MPERLSFEEAARLVVGRGTAWDGLVDRVRLQTGETVLITAAAGAWAVPPCSSPRPWAPARWA